MIEITIPVVLAMILALAEGAKRMGLNPKWIPALDLALGLLGAFAYARLQPMGTVETAFLGVLLGLSASGLYSGVKNTKEGVLGR